MDNKILKQRRHDVCLCVRAGSFIIVSVCVCVCVRVCAMYVCGRRSKEKKN